MQCRDDGNFLATRTSGLKIVDRFVEIDIVLRQCV